MKRNDSQIDWYAACLETPFRGDAYERRVGEAHRKRDPSLLLDLPGVCLKSIATEGPHGFPEHTGILVSYDAKSDQVLVRGHNSAASPPCTWTGTVAEYLAMWEVD